MTTNSASKAPRLEGVEIHFSSPAVNSGGIKTLWSGKTSRETSLNRLQEGGRALVLFFLAAKALKCSGNWAINNLNTVLEGYAGTPARQLHTVWSRLTQGHHAQLETADWLDIIFPNSHLAGSAFLNLVSPEEKRAIRLFTVDYNDRVLSAEQINVQVAGKAIDDAGQLFGLIIKFLGLTPASIQTARSAPQSIGLDGQLIGDLLRFIFFLQCRIFMDPGQLGTPGQPETLQRDGLLGGDTLRKHGRFSVPDAPREPARYADRRLDDDVELPNRMPLGPMVKPITFAPDTREFIDDLWRMGCQDPALRSFVLAAKKN